MAIFGWKKKDEPVAAGSGASKPPTPPTATGATGGSGGDAGSGGFEYSPEKGRRWFDHARVSHEAGNHEYAMACWLNGLRFDPGNLDSVKAFTASANMFMEQNKKGPTKDILKAITGRTDVDKYLSALVDWACKPRDQDYAVAAAAGAEKIGLSIILKWMLPSTLKVVAGDPKPRKSNLVKLMEIAEKQEAYDVAVQSGEAAMRLDPADTKLSTFVRNLAAQSTMSKGGYEDTGKEGGYRQNIRDSDKQRLMDEADKMSRTEESTERLINVTKTEYAANPLDKPTVRKLAKLLLERAAPGDEEAATALYLKAYTDTQEFGFREAAGEIKVRRGRRALKRLLVAVDANPEDVAAKEAFHAARREQLAIEAAEFELRVSAYPTKLDLKLDLGKRYFELGKHAEAIDQFQQAKSDPKLRGIALYALGLSFQAIDWHDEAIDTFRVGLEAFPDKNDNAATDLKYGLMCSLQKRADEMKDLPSAEEALSLASNISMQQIGYKDIRVRRDQIKQIVVKLKGGGA